MISFAKRNINIDNIGLILILFSEICLYNKQMVSLFLIVNGLGMVMVFLSLINKRRFIIYKKSYPIWLTFIYFLFLFYQFVALRAGNATWDTLLWRYFENLCIYSVIINDLRENKDFAVPFIWAGFFSIVLLLKNELSVILTGQIRIGTSLSGNENTVGFAFGTISVIIMWIYCKEKSNKKYRLGLFVLFTIFMLLTGSKKVLVFLVANVIIYFFYNRNKISGWIKVAIIIGLAIYAIFEVDFFYDILGHRIIDAVETMLYGKNTIHATYSYSTDVRKNMIKEALQLWREHPIIGGGYNYFLLKTQYPYSYSHCNYTELLCSFGIFGILVFYSRHLYQITYFIKQHFFKKYYDKDLMILGIMLTVLILAIEFAAVTFSAQSIWYLPITISAACYDYLHEIEYMYK